MNGHEIIEEAKEYVLELFAGNSGGHDAGHTMRVYANAMEICETEKDCDGEIVALAALLHDADDYKLFNTENNENARRFLCSRGYPEEKTEKICEVINGVSFSKNRGKMPATTEGKIVQDADRLDAIGAIGIARTFAYGGEHRRSLEDSVKHFHEKLFLIRDELNTETAKKIAAERHAFMERFIEELTEEQKGIR